MGENIFREAGDWQRTLAERRRAEEERVKASREGEVAWGVGGGGEEEKSRRGGGGELVERRARVVPAVNLLYACVRAVAVSARVSLSGVAPAANETVYRIDTAIISQMTVASAEERS